MEKHEIVGLLLGEKTMGCLVCWTLKLAKGGAASWRAWKKIRPANGRVPGDENHANTVLAFKGV